MAIAFPTLEDVVRIHRNQIALYGGDIGVHDEGLLRSAIATAEMTFGGVWLHQFPHGMAAAFLFHICANHAFIDGNKRAAFATALFFLDVNGYDLDANQQDAENLVLGIARGELEMDAVIEFFRQRVKPK